jgi:type II pantothenate kinase
MNAEKYNLDRIYFGGCFIRGHQATISTLSYAIRFWSKGTKRAFFLRHEGYLGAIGAWLRHVGDPAPREASGKGFANGDRPLGVPTPVAELPEPSLTNGFPSPAARHVSNPLAAPQARAPFSPLAQSNGDEPPSARRPALSASMPPALLEALGGVSLDAHAPPPALANGDAHEQEEHEPDSAEEEDEDEDEEAPSDLAALLASLSPEDAALLGPLLSSGPGSKGEPDVLELLARMDAAEDAAVGLEERLDGFLGRLDGLLQEQEARQGEQPSDGAQEHSSPRPQ